MDDLIELNKEDSIFSDVLSIVKTVAISIAIALFINNFIIINAKIPTGSMETTIMTGDRVIVNRLYYNFEEVKRGDIVVFMNPNLDDDKELLIKRVIGLPNETIDIVNGVVFVNGVEYAEDYISNNDEFYNGTFEVPEDSYFMLGDNRMYSIDSRYWTNSYVSEDKILGKALLRYFPNISFIN